MMLVTPSSVRMPSWNEVLRYGRVPGLRIPGRLPLGTPVPISAAINATLLTSGSDATDRGSGNPYTTASITPSANALVLYCVAVSGNGSASFNITGNGLTGTSVEPQAYDTIAAPSKTLRVYRAMGAGPTTGTVSIEATTNVTGCIWDIIEFTDVDTSGTNGSGAVVQSQDNAADSSTGIDPDPDLAAFGDAVNNACFMVFSCDQGAADVVTPEAGFTELSSDRISTAPVIGLQTAWKLGEELTPRYTNDTSRDMAIIGIEIKAATGGGGVLRGLVSGATENRLLGGGLVH